MLQTTPSSVTLGLPAAFKGADASARAANVASTEVELVVPFEPAFTERKIISWHKHLISLYCYKE